MELLYRDHRHQRLTNLYSPSWCNSEFYGDYNVPNIKVLLRMGDVCRQILACWPQRHSPLVRLYPPTLWLIANQVAS